MLQVVLVVRLNTLYEVTFSIEGGTSDLQYVTTQVSAFMPQTAKALVEAQYGQNCHVISVYEVS
jgi:hypothetical protein